MNIKFDKNNEIIEFTYNGLKIIQTDNTIKVYKDLILNSSIFINDYLIKKDNIFYFNELTKTNDYINLNKKSFLIDDINNNDCSNIINWNEINRICNCVNSKYDYELLSVCDGDTFKLINMLFEIEDLSFLNLKKLEIILDNFKLDRNNLIVLDNLSWLKLEDLYKYLNKYNFLILTNDIRTLIKNIDMLELIVNNKKEDYVEFLSKDKIISYLEKQLNEPVDELLFNKFLYERDSFISMRIWFVLKNI